MENEMVISLMDRIFRECKAIVDKHYPKLDDREKAIPVAILSSQVWFQLYGAWFASNAMKKTDKNMEKINPLLDNLNEVFGRMK